VLADFSDHPQQRGGRVLDVVQNTRKGFFRYSGVVAKGKQDLPLALQLLQQIRLQVGASCHFENLE